MSVYVYTFICTYSRVPAFVWLWPFTFRIRISSENLTKPIYLSDSPRRKRPLLILSEILVVVYRVWKRNSCSETNEI